MSRQASPNPPRCATRPIGQTIWVGVLLSWSIVASLVAQTRVAPTASLIRNFRLTEVHLDQFAHVTRTMDRLSSHRAEAPRSDVAFFTVLSMSFVYGTPLTDDMIGEAATLIESGHPDLFAAIRAAGLLPRDYVLVQTTLLLTYPVASAARAGETVPIPDGASDENLTFIQQHWVTVETVMEQFLAAVAEARR